MYIITHALKNLVRNKSRNLLFGIIIFSIILTASACMIINMTSAQAIRYYKEKFGSEVTLTNLSNKQDAQDALSAETLLSFSDSEYIQSKVYSAKIAIIPEGLKVLNDSGSVSSNGALLAKAYVKGTSDPMINEDFTKGLKKIVQGSSSQNANECIISTEFAELNSLSLNDTITVISNIANQPMPIQLKITGIYEDKSLSQQTQSSSSLFYSGNDIYTNFNSLIDSAIFKTYGNIEAKMSLKNPDMLENFKAELKAKGLPDYYNVTTDEDSYKVMIAPIEKIAGIANKVMIGVFISGSIILLLLSLMTIRERKYEIGVLRAMGMKKVKIALSLLIESIMIVCICLSIGLGVAKVSQKPLSSAVIATQVKESEEQKQLIEHVQFGSKEFSDIALASLVLVFISSLSGVLFVTRYEPSKILSESN